MEFCARGLNVTWLSIGEFRDNRTDIFLRGADEITLARVPLDSLGTTQGYARCIVLCSLRIDTVTAGQHSNYPPLLQYCHCDLPALFSSVKIIILKKR